MKLRLQTAALATVLSLFALPALAETPGIKPGLWEMNTKMQSSNPEVAKAMEKAQAQMASMPPEQRKMMEEMMAKQGVTLSGAGAMTVKACITPEMAAKSQIPVNTQGNCTTNQSNVSSNKTKISYTCTNPNSSGEGEVTYSGNTGYTLKMNTKMDRHGKSETMTMDVVGKWLGADCGEIKPVAPPTKAK